MSSPQPRPMATPDLAGLLAKRPPRHIQPSTSMPAIPKDAPSGVVSSAGSLSASDPVSSAVEQGSIESEQKTAAVPMRPRKRRPSTVTATTASGGEGPSRQYKSPKQVYLPRSLHQQCLAMATDRSTTMTALILQAVNATHERLGEALRTESDTANPGDLFAVPQAVVTEPSVQTTMRLTDQQLGVLDDLARQYQTKRSRLLSAALRLYLDEM